MGQTLSIPVENKDYLLVLGGSAILLYRKDAENGMLVFKSALAYSEINNGNRSVPRRLLKSSRLEGSFFLISEGGLPVQFEIDPEDYQIYDSQPSIQEPPATVSTVAQAYGPGYSDDVFVMVVNNNSLRFYSPYGEGYVGSINVAQQCDQVTALYTLPPVTSNGKISLVINCTKGGQDLQYYTDITYLYSRVLDVFQLNFMGIPVATSTHLLVRRDNRVKEHDRRRMSDGVPPVHIAPSQIKRIAAFETNNKSFFFLFQENQNLTLIEADLFFTSPSQGFRTIPGTLQGSVSLPHAIMNDGVLVSAVNAGEGIQNTFDIVTLATDTASSTLAEVARVGRIPVPSTFVDFLVDPSPPTPDSATIEEVTNSITTDPITTQETDEMTSDPPTNTSTIKPNITLPSEGLNVLDATTPEQVGGAVGGVVAFTLILIAAFFIGGLLWKRRKQVFKPQPDSDPSKSSPVVNQPPDVVVIPPPPTKETGEGTSAMVNGETKPTEETAKDLDLPISIEASSTSDLGSSIPSTPSSTYSHRVNLEQQPESGDDNSLRSMPGSRSLTPRPAESSDN